MSEKIVHNNNVELYTESFGDIKNPCILLIMGASASMVWWDEEFCQRLSRNNRFIIRYDNRDVGLSTCYEPGTTNYTVLDMADDAIAILNAYSIKQAHLVGMSLGGMIGQILAIRNPERVLTVTAIASGIWDDNPELPSIDQKILDYHMQASDVNWADRDAVVKYMVNGWKLLNGSAHPFDEEQAIKLAQTEVKRAKNLLSMFNHALLKGGEKLYGKASSITMPFLIIHGTEDPVLPFRHAEIMANTIPKASLHVLKGSGHEIHRAEWENVINLIVKHTSM